jgi:serine/threonine protein kinase
MLISTELRFERRANVGLQGANSEVYFAWDHQLNAELVVKQIKKASISDPAEYFAEASLLYDTRHPNVVDVKYSCADADHIYLAMPKYEGSLHQVLLQRALTVREIVKVGLDMLSGLHHVHSKRLVHFDVKPSNILLEASGRAAVSDFGLSRPVDQHGLATPVVMYEKHFPPEYLKAAARTLRPDRVERIVREDDSDVACIGIWNDRRDAPWRVAEMDPSHQSTLLSCDDPRHLSTRRRGRGCIE